MLPEFLVLLGFVGLLYFFYDSLRSKELASRHGRRYCQRHDLQFLDETVAQRKLGFSRNENGRLGLVRYYNFEFCSDGSRRYQGTLEVRGPWVGNIKLEPYIDNRGAGDDDNSVIGEDASGKNLPGVTSSTDTRKHSNNGN